MKLAIVGGGIAGTSCAQHLCQLIDAYFADIDVEIHLIHWGSVIKTACHLRKLTEHLEMFDIISVNTADVGDKHIDRRVKLISAEIIRIDSLTRVLTGRDGRQYGPFDRICLATGARPHLPDPIKRHLNTDLADRILTLRDTDSIRFLADRLRQFNNGSGTIVLVGNGGIAMELIFAMIRKECSAFLSGGQRTVEWVIRQGYIGNSYLDRGAAEFFLSSLVDINDMQSSGSDIATTNTTAIITGSLQDVQRQGTAGIGSGIRTVQNNHTIGPSVGPHWIRFLEMQKTNTSTAAGDTTSDTHISINYKSELIDLRPCSSEDSCNQKGSMMEITLSTGKKIRADLIVLATGVDPQTEYIPRDGYNNPEIKLSPSDGGILVDVNMQTSQSGIYAAGDVCTVRLSPSPRLWHQMRLWTQARQMGIQCAKSMLSTPEMDLIQNDGSGGIMFELFAHSTVFFGRKVVLLGRYHEDDDDYGSGNEALVRCEPGEEYIKVILNERQRMIGAILVGETDLEETFENLILNGTDLGPVKERLLDPDFDVEDYYD